MCVGMGVTFATMRWRTNCRVGRVHAENMLIYMSIMDEMHMTVMQVIGVIVMLNGQMAAICSMSMLVFFMYLTSHIFLLFDFLGAQPTCPDM
jgi:hypothetical protein